MLIYLQAVIKNLLSIFCRSPSRVKLSVYILQNTSFSPTYSSKFKCYLAGKLPLFLALHIFCFVCFQGQNLRFAPFYLSILVANSLFFAPNYSLFAPKIPLFNHYFALFGHVFNGRKGFIYTNCCGYLCLLPCIQQHFTLHLAAFYLPFCTKTHCIQHQNTLRFALNCTAISGKMHHIQQ